jgi:hypothetical protein
MSCKCEKRIHSYVMNELMKYCREQADATCNPVEFAEMINGNK